MPGTHTTDRLRRSLPGRSSQALAATCTATPEGIRLALSGELDLATAPIADGALREAEQDAHELVLDVRRVTFMDATGLTVVIDAGERARAAGRRFVVRVRSGAVQRLFELTRTDRRIEVVVEPAIVAFDGDDAGAATGSW